jgi:TP901 family phage tail tape measure protein
MADETISTRIVANADFSALIADVHKVTASLSRLQEKLASSNKMMANQIAVMNRSFSDTVRSTGQFSTHFVSLTSDVEKFGKNLDGGKLKLNQYFNAFRDQTRTSGGLIRDLAKQQVALQNAVLQPLGRNAQGLMQFNVHVPRGLDTIKNKTALARTELQIMNKVVQDGAAQVINFGKNTQWTGRQLTVGLTVPLVAFGNAAAKAFREADQELVRLTKVYGDVAGTSAQELGKVRKEVTQTAREISAAMGVSFKETIGLAADIAATGKTGDELLGSIKETTRLAVLGEVDRQEAMKATLAIQSAFKQNTEELSESINFLNAVENQTSTTLNDLVEAIPKAGPVIQGLGGSVQDLALYLTAMREGGINASEGANALKSALASLINPTDVAVGKFKTLGIDLLGIVNNNAGNLTGTLMSLQGALDSLDPLQKQQAIEQLFGKFQFSRLNALFENLGRQGSQTLQVLDLMKASSEELANVAGRELTAVTESASGKYRRALEGLKASLAEVGEQFLVINTALITVIDKIVQFAMNLPGPVKQVLALLGGITAIAGPLIMLTGLLANFFGNMAKGVFHLKAFFKGGEGFKYLTPEMLAAQKAGKLVEESFYSDAKAASVLQQALRNLLDEFSLLEAKAKSGAMSVNPAVSTMAGNLVMSAGGGRVVDPSHPLVGPMGTRSSSHMVPRSGMTEAQRLQQTMFGMVPGSGPVNQKIGQNPQIYMEQDLPNVAGLTRINGVSTGIVAGEAARHHAMMATLAMQSKEEIVALKKQIVATGTVSKDLMLQFDGMLPVVSQLTSSAAQQSAMIVAELRAGTINIEQARARIIQLNLDIERMMAQAVQAQAGTLGRTINPTMIPTLNQPVVDPTGKSNMRELFKKGGTRDFINKVAGALGVRTSGAGYNIETTKPRRMATGGMVYRKKGSEGPEFAPMGTDTVPAMLTPGEFVVKASSVTPETLPILKQMNEGYIRGPEMETVQTARTTMSPSELKTLDPSFRGSKPSYEVKGTSGLYVGNITDPAIVSKYPNMAKNGMITREMINKALEADVPGKQLPAEVMMAGIAARTTPYRSTTEQFLYELAEQGQITKSDARMASNDIHNLYEKAIKNRFIINDKSNPLYGVSDSVLKAKFGHNANLMNLWGQFSSSIGAHTPKGTPGSRRSTTARTLGLTSLDGSKVKISKLQGNKSTTMVHASTPGPLLKRISGAGITQAVSRALPFMFSRGRIRMASGGMVPNVQYMEDGSEGPVKPSFSSGFNAARNKPSGGGGMSAMGQTGMFMGGMGLSMAGNSVGGTAGTIMSSAGMAMQFLPMLSGLKGVMGGLTKVSALTKTFGSIAGTVFRIAGTAIKFFTGPVGLAVIGITALVAIFKMWRKNVEDNKREQTSMFGVTEKSAKELGITYVSLTDKLKNLREEQKLAADKAKAYFESYTASGVRGLTLTIQQLKELKERVKSDMPETLGILNNIDSSKINDWAANLKAQMISSGKSVEDATNLIYALIESSNKAGQGVGAISSKMFSGITDQGSSATFILKNLSQNIKDISNIDASAFASNVDTAISSLDSAVKSLVGTKDASGNVLDEQEAIAIQFERMTEAGIKNNEIGKDALKTIKSQRPELAGILNQSDTIGGMYAKWRLYLQGVSIDLSKITSAQAETLATFTAALDAAGAAALTVGGGVTGLGKAADLLKTLKEQYDTASKKSNTDKIDSAGLSKKQIKAIQDEIKAIKERADAKKRALRENFDRENAELELQQAKLDLQSAVARGDNEAAAAAQIRIQQIQKESSLKSAEARIDENARKAEAKQQALLDKDQEYKAALQEGVASQGKKANNLGATIKTVSDLGNELTRVAKLRVLSEAKGATKAQKDTFNIEFSNTLQDIAKAAKSDPKVLEAYGQFLAKDAKGNFSKDKDGNFIPLSTNEAKTVSMKRSGNTLTIPKGDALTELDKLSSSMTDFALDITGGKKLSDIYDILNKGASRATTLTAEDLTKALNTGLYDKLVDKADLKKSLFEKDGTTLKDDARELAIRMKKLEAGDQFKVGGTTYNVKDGVSDWTGQPRAVRKAMGGYVTRAVNGITGMTSSQPYLVGERGPELFVPSSGGQIIPNSILGPSYNIASGSSNSVQGGVSSSYNNNVYNIDIDLNGTNVSVNDIMKAMKAEMALIGAKEGRVRTLGGNY